MHMRRMYVSIHAYFFLELLDKLKLTLKLGA